MIAAIFCVSPRPTANDVIGVRVWIAGGISIRLITITVVCQRIHPCTTYAAVVCIASNRTSRAEIHTITEPIVDLYAIHIRVTRFIAYLIVRAWAWIEKTNMW